MPAAERMEFEERLRTDSELRQELEQFKSLRRDLDWHFAASDVRTAAALRRELEAKKRRRNRWLLTALALLAIGVATWFWVIRETPKTEYPVLQGPPQPNPTEPLPTQTPENQPVENVPEKKPPVPQSRPIAGDLRPDESLLRDFPQEEVSKQFVPLFDSLMAGFSPTVPEAGSWAKIVRSIRKNEAAAAATALKKLKTNDLQKDTAAYLMAVSDLLLKRPVAAEANLYPLLAVEKWKTEARYLLVWAFLLEGNEDGARAGLKSLPEGFRRKKEIVAFLEK